MPTKAPDFKSDLIAVSVLRPIHDFVRSGASTNSANGSYIRTLKSFAVLRHTLYNLHLYSISRETRSEHWGATPTLPAPVPKNQVLRRIGIPTTFTRHSELFDNFCYYPNTLNSNFFLLVIAIGLLVPRPYLIARLLGHQRRLSSWCTMVWNSHQLIPNMAYSPQGRLLRER